MPSLTHIRRIARDLVTHPSAGRTHLAPAVRFLGWQVLKRLRPRPITVRAFGQGLLRCYPDRWLTNSVIYYGWPDWEEMHLLDRALRPGDAFLDVGANVGIYSVLAWTRIRPDGRLVAVEPDPETAAVLRENLALNGARDATVLEAAAGAEAGTVRFETGRDAVGRVATGGGRASREVALVTLDEAVGDGDDLAIGKIDVEGYEEQAFRGATSLLAARRPRCWIVETNATSDAYARSRDDLQALFAEHGFDLYEVLEAGTRLRPIPTGGPYPLNALAVGDLAWLRERVPQLVVEEGARASSRRSSRGM